MMNYKFPWEVEGGGFWSKNSRDIFMLGFKAGVEAQEESEELARFAMQKTLDTVPPMHAHRFKLDGF